MCTVDEIVFGGHIASGIGRHSTLGIPGHTSLPCTPSDWPLTLYPGSLNILVSSYPEQLADRGLPSKVAALDEGCFQPAFEIPGTAMQNNVLVPTQGQPRRGDAQVWHAVIRRIADSLSVGCWVLRRIGSSVGEQLEFVAGERLRDRGLQDGDFVAVSLYGHWKNA